MCAKTIFTGTPSQVRGHVGGLIYSFNKSGTYIKGKSSPINVSSIYKPPYKSNFGFLSQFWRSQLTEIQRVAWNSATINFPKLNWNGDTYYLSGIALFTELNTNLFLIDLPMLISPPSAQTLENIDSTEIIACSNSQNVFVSLTPNAIPASSSILLRLSSQISPGVSFNEKYLRLLLFADGSITNPIDLSLAYTKRFGVLIEGMKILLQTLSINKTSGEAFTTINNSCIVSATCPSPVLIPFQITPTFSSFTVGETITGGTSGATLVFNSYFAPAIIDSTSHSGVFIVGETITGGTSGATAIMNAIPFTATLTSVTGTWVTTAPFGVSGGIIDDTTFANGIIFNVPNTTTVSFITGGNFTVTGATHQLVSGATGIINTLINI